MADFPAAMWRRTKQAPAYDWVDTDFLRGLNLAPLRPLSSVLGRLSKAIDDDVQLLCLAGVEFERMELRRYQADPLRTSLCLDGRIVREYTLTIKVDEG